MIELSELRQRAFPKPFRIERPRWPSDAAEWLRVIAARGAMAGAAVPPPPVNAPIQESMDFLAVVGTGLWRLKQRMVQPGTDRPLEEMRRAYRHLESTWDALAQAGVEIIDHTGKPYDTGLAIKVIAFQPVADLTRERVIETLKPTIYYHADRLQMGEVIVGTPQAGGATP